MKIQMRFYESSMQIFPNVLLPLRTSPLLFICKIALIITKHAHIFKLFLYFVFIYDFNNCTCLEFSNYATPNTSDVWQTFHFSCI